MPTLPRSPTFSMHAPAPCAEAERAIQNRARRGSAADLSRRKRNRVRERRRSAAVSLHDRPVGPVTVTIPVRARLTAHRKSACWALRRLDGPTTNLRYQSRVLRSKRTDTADDQSRQCHLPQRLHTPRQRPRSSAREESGQHGGVDPNFPAYSGGLSATRSGLRVSAAHRPATRSSGDRQNDTVSIPPLGIL
jgi:hypothetical protein